MKNQRDGHEMGSTNWLLDEMRKGQIFELPIARPYEYNAGDRTMNRIVRIAERVAAVKTAGLVDNLSNLEKEVASLQKELLRVRSSFRDTFEAVQSDMERNRAEPLKMRKIQGLRDKVMSWFDDADGALDSIRTEVDVISVTLPPGMERYAVRRDRTSEDN